MPYDGRERRKWQVQRIRVLSSEFRSDTSLGLGQNFVFRSYFRVFLHKHCSRPRSKLIKLMSRYLTLQDHLCWTIREGCFVLSEHRCTLYTNNNLLVFTKSAENKTSKNMGFGRVIGIVLKVKHLWCHGLRPLHRWNTQSAERPKSCFRSTHPVFHFILESTVN